MGRHWLHAAVLGFAHPVSGESLRFVSALPVELRTALAELRALA
jgi:23S rRNA pseudouridine1911/1915/1917 synthase